VEDEASRAVVIVTVAGEDYDKHEELEGVDTVLEIFSEYEGVKPECDSFEKGMLC